MYNKLRAVVPAVGAVGGVFREYFSFSRGYRSSSTGSTRLAYRGGRRNDNAADLKHRVRMYEKGV